MCVLKKLGRIFVRVWFFNRNFELKRQHKAFLKAYRKRAALWSKMEHDDKVSWLEKDPVWRNAHELFHELEKVFEPRG